MESRRVAGLVRLATPCLVALPCPDSTPVRQGGLDGDLDFLRVAGQDLLAFLLLLNRYLWGLDFLAGLVYASRESAVMKLL